MPTLYCTEAQDGVAVGAGATLRACPMHPHPGFPSFSRLDDACGYCADPFPLADDKEYELRLRSHAQSADTTASSWRRIAAIAAVVLIATAAVYRRRGG